MIAFLQPLMEGSAAYDDLPNVGIPILALSGGLAFALNVAGVYLIHSAGSLVLTLSGVLKVSHRTCPHSPLPRNGSEADIDRFRFVVVVSAGHHLDRHVGHYPALRNDDHTNSR